MYVSIVCDFNSDNSRKVVDSILMQYGFNRVQTDTYEMNSIGDNSVSKLKLEIDRHCDAFDKVRLYQYPLDHKLVISYLHEKRWKKKIILDKSIIKG
ncbi:CRISPR-associated protein Cas2 [Thiospirochaeta perfilievii]|uniref:CRISPR-associated endoribonuclease Cas2 n=1 Tax=Thiospirochaeta perfilievii TaxID=252967 RepID=A0A5C1QA56_9SPIO|nr:CRISPR-associated protein Cas2 [Thiospirochaeta perfilievii]QEN03799.1 CRISPR-associated protein Cas2 [Thiospirochaeta perfilievii]